MPDRSGGMGRRKLVGLGLLVAAVAAALFVVTSGRWRGVYAFLIQFHQRTLWAALLIASIPVLIVVLLRAWGVEDVPYEEEAPELGTGRLESVVSRIARSPRDAYAQALLTDEICEAATLVAALNAGLDPSVVRKRCRTGSAFEVEPVLQDLIADRRLAGTEREAFLSRFRKSLTSIEDALKGGTD